MSFLIGGKNSAVLLSIRKDKSTPLCKDKYKNKHRDKGRDKDKDKDESRDKDKNKVRCEDVRCVAVN